MKTPLKFLALSLIIYVSLVGYARYTQYKLVQKEKSFDLDQNGFINGDEITEDSRAASRAVASDTGRTFVVITGIPVALFLSGLILLFLKIPSFLRRISQRRRT